MALFALSPEVEAQTTEPCGQEMARITSVQGEVELRWNDGASWKAAGLDDVLCAGTTIRTQAFSRAALAFTNDSTLRLDQLTTLTIRAEEAERRSWLEMLTGAIHFFSHRPRALRIDTPFVNAAAEGTEFLIRLGFEEGHIIVYEGMVLAQNEQGELLRGPGDAALIRRGQKPIPEIVARPRDAVAWAVHYPPVLSDLADGGEPGAYPAALHIAINRTRDGNYQGALRTLDLAKPNQQDARLETFRAGILLNIGRVGEAEAAIERALTMEPTFGLAFAQRAIFGVVNNDREAALADADRAVELTDGASTALVAQSYARQANFDLEGARESLRNAVTKNPMDALAHARLSEIELSFGDLDKANQAAAQATRLAPNLARTQTVQGFSYLAEIDTDAAKEAFSQAITLDSTDPLAYLGQGLAKIRDGDLAAGRRDLEIAAGLDPNNALIRSYLGKAYFEEKRGPKDATQFEIAKQLDPQLPTPWFYNAIRKQTENRPVEAFTELERAIELNGQRAVYRSVELLEADEAARLSNLARIYDDLGFDQLAVAQATDALRLDPTSHSAHRFLSDAYSRLDNYEIARVSELLQAQLLQPINLDPVQPSLAVSDLNVTAGTGPSEVAYSEFHPLFERDGVNLTASTAVGNNRTFGDELVASVLWDRLSISAGQFHFEGKGFRQNNEINNDLHNLFSQFSITPKFSLQTEYRHRDTKQGDLSLNFDLDDFSSDKRSLDEEIVRFGTRYSPSPQSDVLISLFHVDRIEKQDFFFSIPSPDGNLRDFVTDSRLADDGVQGEIQYLGRSRYHNLVAGGSFYDIDADLRVIDTERKIERKQASSYIYTNLTVFDNIAVTLGLSYDDFEEFNRSAISWNPKLGVQWKLTKNLSIRGSALRTIKPALVVEQTLQPTQLAGFNQFFDDPNGTEVKQYGIGLDVRVTDMVYGGVELISRNLDTPLLNFQSFTVDIENRRQNIARFYAYWAINNYLAFSAEYQFEKIRRNPELNIFVPKNIETTTVPLFLRYFSPNGFFGEAGLTILHQNVDRASGSPIDEGVETEALVDLTAGYKMPNRRSVLSLEVKNLFDRKFSYHDRNFFTSEIHTSTFTPSLTFLARATLHF